MLLRSQTIVSMILATLCLSSGSSSCWGDVVYSFDRVFTQFNSPTRQVRLNGFFRVSSPGPILAGPLNSSHARITDYSVTATSLLNLETPITRSFSQVELTLEIRGDASIEATPDALVFNLPVGQNNEITLTDSGGIAGPPGFQFIRLSNFADPFTGVFDDAFFDVRLDGTDPDNTALARAFERVSTTSVIFATAVPEPGSFLLLTAGICIATLRRRRT